MRFFNIGIFVLVVLLCVAVAHAVGPGTGERSKRVGIDGLGGSNCNENSVTAKWRLDSLLGAPLVNGSWKWTGSGECEAHYSTVVWLKIETGDGYGYIKINPVVPKVNAGYGYNTAGSPDWDELICGYQGSRATNCLPEDTAKHFWRNGQITDFFIVWDNN